LAAARLVRGLGTISSFIIRFGLAAAAVPGITTGFAGAAAFLGAGLAVQGEGPSPNRRLRILWLGLRVLSPSLPSALGWLVLFASDLWMTSRSSSSNSSIFGLTGSTLGSMAEEPSSEQ